MSDTTIRVLVVDDSVIYRKLVRNLVSELLYVDLIGVASNGDIAMQIIQQEKPDLVTLDLEMPVLDGLGVLQKLQDQNIDVGAIMLSSATSHGAKATTQALALGAFDFVLKPATSNYEESYQQIRDKLFPKLEAFYRTRSVKKALQTVGALIPSAGKPHGCSITEDVQSGYNTAQKPFTVNKISVLAIGISTGGPAALAQLLPKLSADFQVPILIVQHMPPVFTKSLAEDLDNKSALHVVEAADGDEPLPGTAYIAPGGCQMKIVLKNKKKIIRITSDPPEQSCRPSVDYLFRSLASVWPVKKLGLWA